MLQVPGGDKQFVPQPDSKKAPFIVILRLTISILNASSLKIYLKRPRMMHLLSFRLAFVLFDCNAMLRSTLV
jgi:hypothetical protein